MITNWDHCIWRTWINPPCKSGLDPIDCKSSSISILGPLKSALDAHYIPRVSNDTRENHRQSALTRLTKVGEGGERGAGADNERSEQSQPSGAGRVPGHSLHVMDGQDQGWEDVPGGRGDSHQLLLWSIFYISINDNTNKYKYPPLSHSAKFPTKFYIIPPNWGPKIWTGGC